MRSLPITASLLGLLACSSEPASAPADGPTTAPPPAAPAAGVGNIPDAARIAPGSSASQLELARELLSRFDADGDGLLSAAEHGRFALAEPSFQTLDLDASGSLDEAEVLLAIETTDPGYSTRWR